MAIMTLSSNNPNFSHVVAKNPATQVAQSKPFSKPLRKGMVYGWFNDAANQQFTVFFKDHPTDMSYSDNDFNYLDISRYTHPYAYIGMVTELLSTASKGSEYDVEVGPDGTKYEYSVWLNVELADRQISNYFDLSRADSGAQAGIIRLEGATELLVRASTMKKALALTQLICLASALSRDDIYIPMREDSVEKYFKMLNSAGATYKMRRLIINRTITNPQLLEKIRSSELLDVVHGPTTMQFVFGVNEVQRLNLIKKLLGLKRGVKPKSDTLVDIGSGEAHNSLKLCEHYDLIVAYDKDPEAMEMARGKVKKRDLTDKFLLQETEVNKETFETDESFFDEADVLLTEVLEHMPKDDAKHLLELVLGTSANNVIVSVPCGEFNQFYGIEPGLVRHHDHKWEPTRAEWKDFVDGLDFDHDSWAVHFQAEAGNIDHVNGIPCTMFVRFERVSND